MVSASAPKAVEPKEPGEVELASGTLQDAVKQLRASAAILQLRRETREANLAPKRPGDPELRQLDSSVKRNTALIKRLRQISEDTREALLQDIARTNQSKYVTEAVAAVADASLKSKDVAAAVQVCSALHQRYAEFSQELVPAIAVNLTPQADDDKATSIRRRSMFKLLAELRLAGLYNEDAPLLAAVRSLADPDFARDRDRALMVLLLLGHFAKGCREELLGLAAKDATAALAQQAAAQDSPDARQALADYQQAKAVHDAEVRRRYVLPEGPQRELRQALGRLCDKAFRVLEQDHTAVVAKDQRNLGILNSRGDLPENMASAYEQKRKLFDTLQRSIVPLAELLDKQMPDLPEPSASGKAGEGSVVGVFLGKDSHEAYTGPFEDEQTRVFYETLPDLRATIPGALLGDTGQGDQRSSSQGHSSDQPDAGDGADLPNSEAAAAATDLLTPEGGTLEGAEDARAAAEAESIAPGTANAEARAAMDAVVEQLQLCVSKDQCDAVAVAFCYANNKAARKRMVRALLDTQHGNPQMLPFYCRITATLNQVFPDIGEAVVEAQKADFMHLRGTQRDVTHPQKALEARLRNARFLAELVKFRVLPFGKFFTLLKRMLDEFVHHNIDVACTMIETAGRFLFLLPETHERMNNMAQSLIKLREKRTLDARQSMMAEIAFMQCQRPEKQQAVRRKRRSAEQEWMRHLVLQQLSKEQIKHVLKKLRRLPWAASEPYLVRVLLKASKGRFSHIPLVASLAANLNRYHPSLGVAVVDALLEEVRYGLEVPESGTYQRRVGHMRLLGEMYNFRLVDSKVIFETLYLLISFGHSDPTEAERLDPPDSYFRVRLGCTLLDTCGHFFAKGQARKRLERYLAYLQRYVLGKPALPLDMEYDLQDYLLGWLALSLDTKCHLQAGCKCEGYPEDLLERLQPNIKRCETFEEAVQAVAALEAAEAKAQAAGLALGAIEEEQDEERASQDSNSEGGGQEAQDEVEQDEGDGQDASSLGDPEEDDTVHVLEPVKEAEVDEDFERELAALVGDSAPRSAAAVGGGLTGVPVFVQRHAGAAAYRRTGGQQQQQVEPEEAVAFRVMLRRGGREDKTKAVQLPASSAMAVNLRAKTEAEEQERAEIKRLVLKANRQQEASSEQAVPLMHVRQNTLPPGGVPQKADPPQAALNSHSHHGRGKDRYRGPAAGPATGARQPLGRVSRGLEDFESQFT